MSAADPTLARDFLRFHARLLGWRSLLLPMGLCLGAWINRAGAQSVLVQFNLDLGLMAACVMAWHALAGARLVRLLADSVRLRLPALWPHVAFWIGLGTLLGVILPALLQLHFKPAEPGIFALSLGSLAVAAAVGLLWACTPAWVVGIVLLGSPLVVLAWATGNSSGVSAVTGSPPAMAVLALALLAVSAACLAHALGPRFRGGSWTTPLPLLTATSSRATSPPGSGADTLLRLLGMATPVPRQPRALADAALGIALGPGFGRLDLADSLLLCLVPLAVCLAWLALPMGSTTAGQVFAPLLVMCFALAPVLRLQAVLSRPGLGLHELGLLPGLGTNTARALDMRLRQAVLGRALPPLAMMLCFALAIGANAGYYLVLLSIVAGGLVLGLGSCIFTLRSGSRPRWILGLLLVAMALLSFLVLNLYQAQAPGRPGWIWAPLLLSATATLAGLGLRQRGLRRLQARRALWQLN
jgi:hypothetical protein